MKQIALVVEGQTEEGFVQQVLAPYLAARQVFVVPIIPQTSRTAHGAHKGGAPWSEYHKLARRLAHQPQWHRVGVLLDLYGCPSDTPGRQGGKGGRAYHQALTARLIEDLSQEAPVQVLPHLFLHEFETLVFAALGAGSGVFPSDVSVRLNKMLDDVEGEPELVNGGQNTSPSHRLMAAWDGYLKTVDGIRAIADVPFEEILRRCPTFAAWLEELVA